MNTEVMYVLLLKFYAVFMLLGSGVFWFVFFVDQYKTNRKIQVWAYFGFIIVGLLLSLYFIDGWRPPN